MASKGSDLRNSNIQLRDQSSEIQLQLQQTANDFKYAQNQNRDSKQIIQTLEKEQMANPNFFVDGELPHLNTQIKKVREQEESK